MSVLQDWVGEISMKEQTVILCGLRGPDAGGSDEVKALVRWIRRTVLKSADPGHGFMSTTGSPDIREFEGTPFLERLPVHYLGHLIHAFEVIGYRHPDVLEAGPALSAYIDLCDFLHVNAETIEQMTDRLRDVT